ncbi:SpoIVB peptidase [Clostridium sp. NSJ-145]|uniref:SpoIVB peptidase n=1 Tax=Clostridium sp. NSJ-145 TaxID=2897777 RepID=UPI001E606E46|nr:SpoIVB peptidase [Clostridium sp. NSJ-145]MCD2500192.1 SpoIVB peptidase [Clostridium sp. NSJ-145]
MIKKFIKRFSIIAAPMFILTLITYLSISRIPDKIYINEESKLTDLSLHDNSFLNKIKLNNDKLNIDFLGLFPIKSVAVQTVPNLEVYPGGTSVGVKLSTNGVLVVGYSNVETLNGTEDSPGKSSGIELGDMILKVNGTDIESSKDLISKVKSSNSDFINVEILRGKSKLTKEIKLLKEGEEYKLGLWVRDSTAGIGTLTFYHEDSDTFGALGHPITDSDTNTVFSIKNGELLRSSILSVRKGQRGAPGELKGLFLNEKESIGSISRNMGSGIYGKTSEPLINPVFNEPMQVGYRNEINEGPAKIITTIGEDGPKLYDIEIVKLLPQDKPGAKSMIIKVTDEELLSRTGGIVQGMSGSPIIQNDKIIGAVTHVLINKPDYGYGIYIEWMLKDAEILP